MDERIIKAHKCCMNNEPALHKSEICGCFHCLKIFDPYEIEDWIQDQELTALCPYCGIDAVIADVSGYPITREFLAAMEKYWFDDLPPYISDQD